MRQSLAILFIFFIISSCQTNDWSTKGLIINRYSDGQVLCKVPFYLTKQSDTIIHGNVVYYYPNAVIEDSFFVVHGKKEGSYFRFDSMSVLKSILNYKADKLDDYSFLYYPSGTVEVIELYLNDSLISNRELYPNGKTKSYFIFENSKETCYSYIFDSITNSFEESGDSIRCKKVSISRIRG